MNTATVSEAVSTPSWSTPVTSTTQSWPTSTGYEQYYNYYQTVPPPATTTAATTATPAYQQDYSQAWDEYYKAYYGQSYATTTTPSQYPTNYSYDQYGYANFSAPPPNYYDATPQSSGYDYTQATPSVSSASFPSYNTAPTTTMPPTTNWSEPPPSFAQPSTYNNAQTFEQPQTFSQPPPISTTYETSMDQNNMSHPSIDQQIGSYGDPMQNKQKFNNPKMYESNQNSNFKSNQSALSNSAKETSYLEQFPPPSFGSPVKPMTRGRGASNFNNNRGRGQGSRGNSNFNAGRNQQFNRNNQYGNKSNTDRRAYGSNDYSDESTSFSNNTKSNFMGNKRGNRGNYNFNRGRNMENQGFQQRSKTESWYQQDDINETANNETEFEEADFFQNNEKKQDFGESAGFLEWNNEKLSSQNQNYPQQNIDPSSQKRDFEPPKYPRNMDGPHNQKPGFENQEFNSRMNLPNQQQRNGAFFNSNIPGNNRPAVRNMDRNPRAFQHPRQQFQRAQGNFSVNKPPMKLMDVVVQLSTQSPVIKRRQNMVDQWQRDIKELQNRRIPITYFWPIMKSALSAEIQDMLFVHCFPQVNGLICELILDDIFLVQARGEDEETAIESGSKALFDMFKNRVFVITSTRDADGEAVPGFCISPAQQGPINLPPICRATAEVNINAPFITEPECDNQVTIKPIATKPAPISQIPKLDPGLFLVLESSTNERDQSIASLVATSRFNNAVIDYQHEKLPHAPHISSCVITIDGVEIERHEARDYLVAKRQAADKVVAKLKQTRPQIALRLDKAKVVKKEEVKKEESFDKSITEFLQNYATSFEDIPLKFDSDFNAEERITIQTTVTNLNLGSKSEGKTTLFVFKQFPLVEMKNRLLNQGFCSQYQLIEKGSDCSSQ